MTIYDHLHHQADHGTPTARQHALALLWDQEPETEAEAPLARLSAADAEVLGQALASGWGREIRRGSVAKVRTR